MAHVGKGHFIGVMIVSVVMGIKQQIIPNLRQFSIAGWMGDFEANEVVLQNIIRHRVMQDSACGYDVFRELHSSFTKVTIIYEGLVDHTFQQELPDRLKQTVATTYRQLAVVINIANNTHFQLLGFTDSTKQVLDPFATNYDELKYIDRIEDDGKGHVVLFEGEDFLSLEIDDYPDCDEMESEELNEKGEDQYIIQYKTTNYPSAFDWGCELLENEVEFCGDLENNCELRLVGGDVCNLIQTTSSPACPASMRITNMTGYFRDAFQYIAPFQFPIVNFNASKFEVENDVGLIFPCLTGI